MQTKLPRLTRYADLSRSSGVTAYAITPDSIIVQFTGGKTYEYTRLRPGAAHVERMKRLALSGRGLATYIAQHPRMAYARKL